MTSPYILAASAHRRRSREADVPAAARIRREAPLPSSLSWVTRRTETVSSKSRGSASTSSPFARLLGYFGRSAGSPRHGRVLRRKKQGAQLVGERPDDGVPWIVPRRAHCSPGKSDRSAAGWRLSEWTTCQTVAADVRMRVLSSVGVNCRLSGGTPRQTLSGNMNRCPRFIEQVRVMSPLTPAVFAVAGVV